MFNDERCFMNRRNFIRIMGVGASTMMLSSAVTGCSNNQRMSQPGWTNRDLDESDIRLKILSYAMLCPNPHNKQPWLIKFTGPTSFKLFVDPERLLPETDPYFRQIHIGQGAFLEILEIAASSFGYGVEIKYFPDGSYSNIEFSEKAIASINLVKSLEITIDPLFSEILKRHSNKREYDNVPLTDTEINQLVSFQTENSHYQIHFEQSSTSKIALEQFLTEAMNIETGNRSRDLETIKMFRFNDDEIKKYRDGFGLSQSGVTGIRKYFAEKFFLSRPDAEKDPTSFGEQTVDMVKNQTSSTACFSWLTTNSNERIDQVLIGRDYCRLNLKTSSMGLVQHPMSQILQEYQDMIPLQSKFKTRFNIKQGETVQMLFRLGRAEPTLHSPRRVVKEIVGKSINLPTRL